MATLHVRNVPDDLYELLRERAAANDRSIGAETVQLLQERIALAGYGRPPRGLVLPGRRRRRGGGPGLFTRFTPEARAVVVAAQEHARELGHERVGTEHLLLGVMDADEEAPVRRWLGEWGVTPARVQEEVERDPGRGDAATTGQIPFEPGAKQALELSLREALKLDADAIQPVHVLLGILDQETGRGARIVQAIEPQVESRLRSRLGVEPPSRPAALPYTVRPAFRVLALEGDAEAWEAQLNEAAAHGYDLLEVVANRAILRRF